MNSTILRLIILHFLLGQLIFAQEQDFKIPDSLENKSYVEIYKAYKKVDNDTTKSLIYLNTYLEKAKKDNNEYEIIQSYSFKGGFYFIRWNHKNALNNYFMALEYAKKINNTYYIYVTKYNIALIKDKLGKYDEALKTFKECLIHEQQQGIKDTLDYLITLEAITQTYSKMKIPDSSSHYIKKGLSLAKLRRESIYYEFVFNEGVNLYHRKEYVKAKDSMDKSLPFLPLKDNAYFVNAYFYMGKVNKALKKTDKSIFYYKKIDSVFRITEKHITPEVRESYESLIKYYRSKKDIENQLVYVERLLKFDSILRINNEVIGEKLIKEYDTPELLEEKENLIASINNKNTRYADFIKILIGIVAVISILLYYQYQKGRLYRNRFETLINKEQKVVDNAKITDLGQQPEADIGISEEIIKAILLEIEKFEKKLKFLKPNITINNLATTLNTNNKYLSKIINAYKKKSFTQYINDLRIEYAVEKLQNDTQFRKYTIEAIAKDMGYNSTEVFSKYFRKKTGLYASYFIKELKKQSDIKASEFGQHSGI